MNYFLRIFVELRDKHRNQNLNIRHANTKLLSISKYKYLS